MSTQQWPSKVVPAQLSFLAIYNPSLGPTEETFHDQVVFYYSRAAHEARLAAKRNARNDAAGGDALRQEENEMLRHVGFAQGTVDFARSFSGGEPVDSIETEKSRIVLKELEQGWWILASIDLTRLPAISQSSSDTSKRAAEKQESRPTVEYSSRDVSPPALLVQQLLQAHHIFSLHHGPSLSDLFVRQERDKFCGTLERFWNRFCRNWDVLLHGNPAVDIFSGLKLASGGELGFGVGEEEWGSGERAVLEDLAHRTEDLVDLVVSRFGEPVVTEVEKTASEDEALPWMGAGKKPIASDGVVFGGVGALERHSLRDVSLWMRQIYTYGEHAYGVRDNPLREPRKRRRRNPPEQDAQENGKIAHSRSTSRQINQKSQRQDAGHKQSNDAKIIPKLPVDNRPEMYPRSQIASYDHTTTPEETPTPREDPDKPPIPPPIITAAEKALQQATQQAERKQKGTIQDVPAIEDSSTTLGIPDQYMKYLTLGLSTLAKPATKTDTQSSRRVSTASSKPSQTQTQSKHDSSAKKVIQEEDEENDMPFLTQLEPMPDGETLKSRIEAQKRKENKGHFIIGLKGDLTELDDLSEEDDDTDLTEGSPENTDDGSRIVLRTIQVELVPKEDADQNNPETHSTNSGRQEASMSETLNHIRRLRVLVYVHRPFMYCFLFENRASALQLTKFYKSLHRNLVPIHKPLLSSTSAEKVAQRVHDSHALETEDDATIVSNSSNKLPSKGVNSSPIYNLIYDPVLLKLHTSIPNIPEPGTPAAEGIFSGFSKSVEQPSWTRVEALNVHSQILNTLASVKNRKMENERTSKTSRGWWVLWMKVAPSIDPAHSNEQGDKSALTTANSSNKNLSAMALDQEPAVDTHRVAFLVRKSQDTPVAAKTPSSGSKAMTSMLGVMSLGMAGGSRDEDATGGSSAGWGPQALSGGIGVDARRYVEGLLSLNR